MRSYRGNASWKLWSRPVDHYQVYFHGLPYRATITWHKKEEWDYRGDTVVTWYRSRHYTLVLGRNAYRRNPEHQKKVLSPEEEQRREWKRRESDKRFPTRCPCRRSGPGRWFKKQTTRANRRHAKRCLANGRSEDIVRFYGKGWMGYWD